MNSHENPRCNNNHYTNSNISNGRLFYRNVTAFYIVESLHLIIILSIVAQRIIVIERFVCQERVIVRSVSPTKHVKNPQNL